MRIANILLMVFVSLPVMDNSQFLLNNIEGKSKKSNRKAEVEINYSLLNKQGQTSNIFKEGEDIAFSLTLMNNSGDSLYLDNSFLADGSGFCAVYTQDNELVGQPFSYGGAQIVSSDNHPFFGNQREFTLEIPWKDSRSFWSTLHYNFKGLKQNALPKGKYYTNFKHRFCFDRTSQRPSLCLEPVNIRIDFEVI